MSFRGLHGHDTGTSEYESNTGRLLSHVFDSAESLRGNSTVRGYTGHHGGLPEDSGPFGSPVMRLPHAHQAINTRSRATPARTSRDDLVRQENIRVEDDVVGSFIAKSTSKSQRSSNIGYTDTTGSGPSGILNGKTMHNLTAGGSLRRNPLSSFAQSNASSRREGGTGTGSNHSLESCTSVPNLLSNSSSALLNRMGEPKCVMIYGFPSHLQYAAIEFYERVSKGFIYEDYPRQSLKSRYNYSSTVGRSNQHQGQQRAITHDRRGSADLSSGRNAGLSGGGTTPDLLGFIGSGDRNRQFETSAILSKNRYEGGNCWIKVTFNSAEAAENACHSSPHYVNGYMVHAEMYNGNPPAQDKPIPATPQDILGKVGKTNSIRLARKDGPSPRLLATQAFGSMPILTSKSISVRDGEDDFSGVSINTSTPEFTNNWQGNTNDGQTVKWRDSEGESTAWRNHKTDRLSRAPSRNDSPIKEMSMMPGGLWNNDEPNGLKTTGLRVRMRKGGVTITGKSDGSDTHKYARWNVGENGERGYTDVPRESFQADELTNSSRMPGAKRVILRPADEALLPSTPVWQSIIERIPILRYFIFGGESPHITNGDNRTTRNCESSNTRNPRQESLDYNGKGKSSSRGPLNSGAISTRRSGTSSGGVANTRSAMIIGTQVPRLDSGEFDWISASFYWRFWAWIDWVFGTDFCGIRDE